MAQTADDFSQKVRSLRADYRERREATNLFPPAGRSVLTRRQTRGSDTEPSTVTIWYKDGTALRLYDIPGTLSGDILRIKAQLPSDLSKGPYELKGDEVRLLPEGSLPPPRLPDEDSEEEEDDSEDVSDLVAALPLIDEIDPSKHFLKRSRYRSEIENLLRCQGGACPGKPISDHIIPLLGRSSDGKIVFPKLATYRDVIFRQSTLAVYKQWVLDLLDGLGCLHDLGIVHRDLRLDNVAFTSDNRLVIIDIESKWGQRQAPEIAWYGLDAGWTMQSDMFDVGQCIEGLVYANAPITRQVEWPVPAPLDAIVTACKRADPQSRPSVRELKAIAEAIQCRRA